MTLDRVFSLWVSSDDVNDRGCYRHDMIAIFRDKENAERCIRRREFRHLSHLIDELRVGQISFETGFGFEDSENAPCVRDSITANVQCQWLPERLLPGAHHPATRHLWILDHQYVKHDGHLECKSIGYFERRSDVKSVVERLAQLPGFRRHPNGFVCHKAHLDQVYWPLPILSVDDDDPLSAF